MKKGWEQKQIGDLCDVISGQSPEGKFYNTSGKGMPFYQGKKDFGGKFIETPTKWTTKTTKIAREGDVLMSVRAPVGPVNFATGEVCIGRGLAAIRSGADLDRDFLFYQFLYLQSVIAGREGAVFASINKSEIEDLPVAFAPLPEQQRIVGILDDAFAGIAIAKANAEKNLQNARALFESHLQSVFTQRGEGWLDQQFGELATFRNGINFTKSSQGDSIKIVGVKDFQNNFWAPLDNLKTVTMDGELHDSDTLKENDLLFVRSNGNIELIGRSLLIGSVVENTTHSGFTIRARLNVSDLLPKYLCHYLRSKHARQEMIDSGIGTNIKSLNQKTLQALVIPFPSKTQQACIIDKLEKMDNEAQLLQGIYQQKLNALDDLRKSFLHQAFTGEL